MEKKNDNNIFRTIQINNYVKTKKDFIKIKRAQRLTRELYEKINNQKRYDNVLIELKLDNIEINEKQNDIEEKICRICFDHEETENNKLITPCRCKGTQKYIHHNCLMEWININRHNPEKRDFCDICKYKFRISQYGDNMRYNNTLETKLIKQNVRRFFIKYFLILIMSFCISGIDILLIFPSLTILSAGTCNDKCLIRKNFMQITFPQVNSSMQGYYFYVHVSYIISLISTLNLYCNICHFKRKKVLHDRYKDLYRIKMRWSRYSLNVSSLLFSIFFYISLISNTFMLMQMHVVVFFYLILSSEIYIFNHNSIIKQFIQEAYESYLVNRARSFNTQIILNYDSESDTI